MKFLAAIFLMVFIFFFATRILRSMRNLREKDPERKLIDLDAEKLTPDQKKIYHEYGKPVKILREEAIEFDTILWIYKEHIAKFKTDGTLIKVI